MPEQWDDPLAAHPTPSSRRPPCDADAMPEQWGDPLAAHPAQDGSGWVVGDDTGSLPAYLDSTHRKGLIVMTESIFTRTFAKAAGERAIKTVAQTAAAIIVAAGVGLLDANWLSILSVAGMAGFVSLLTSIGSGLATDGSPSLTTSEILATPYDPQHDYEDAA